MLTAALETLKAQLEALAPAGVVVEVGSGNSGWELMPEERRVSVGWAPHRQAQFTLGRAVARRALSRLGVRAVPILIGRGGAPQWPDGIVASISHKRQNCVVAAATNGLLEGIGIDLEEDLRTDEETQVAGRVCVAPAERAQLVRLQSLTESPASAFLAAKEAFFKLQYPLTGAWLDWDDVLLNFGPGGTFTIAAEFAKSFKVKGVIRVTCGWMGAMVMLRASPQGSRSAPPASNV